ncbi:SDR family NAD(P)-dependent oxidoreductase [Aestuariivita boseongensis]|uniref:SDR family NAD(P)-dependent oxidoreductase n=1 Tax=Aestuariivita boseongensis TaxID=1470562 RepID=UPI000682C488|nr:SDR family NAD(P)-dependent oxidoreductase [Aestuariivita boseongensis]
MTTALIIGAGAGLSASLARKLAARGHKLVLAARDISDLGALAEETSATCVPCNARDRADMERLFEAVDATGTPLSVAIYNPSARVRGPVQELDPEAVEDAILTTAYGAFLMAHHAAKRMLPQGRGAMLFTGASAGVKGFAQSSTFAMGKFALRGLCQSLARELHPQGIHIGHFVIDGGITKTPEDNPGNARLDPDAIADSYMHFLDQHPSSWAWEIELRPWVERF